MVVFLLSPSVYKWPTLDQSIPGKCRIQCRLPIFCLYIGYRKTRIPIFWCMEHKSILPSSQSCTGTAAFNTLRGIRLALSAYTSLTNVILRSSNMFRDKHQRLLGLLFVSHTDNIASQFAAKGLSVLLGTDVRPVVDFFGVMRCWSGAIVGCSDNFLFAWCGLTWFFDSFYGVIWCRGCGALLASDLWCWQQEDAVLGGEYF